MCRQIRGEAQRWAIFAAQHQEHEAEQERDPHQGEHARQDALDSAGLGIQGTPQDGGSGAGHEGKQQPSAPAK